MPRLPELLEIAPDIHHQLYNRDFEWLQANKPIQKASSRGRSRVDWEQRDAQYEQQIRQLIPTLIAPEHPPRRITANAIGKAIGLQEAYLTKNHDKLPRTTKLLAEHTETHEAFALRRIAWVGNQYATEQTCPSESKFIKKAGLSDYIRTPVVMSAVNHWMRVLKQFKGLNEERQ